MTKMFLKSVLIASILTGLVLSTFGAVYDFKELSSNTYGVNTGDLDGGKAVWTEYVDSMGPDIFFFNGNKTSRVTFDPAFSTSVDIDNGYVVWEQQVASADEIFLWNGVSTTQITSTTASKYDLMTDNGLVVWSEGTYSSRDIYLYNGTSIKRLTNNTGANKNPCVDNGLVTWTDGTAVYLYNGSTTMTIASGLSGANNPQVSGGAVLWQANTAAGPELFIYKNGSVAQITSNDYTESDFVFKDGQAAWIKNSGNYFTIPPIIYPVYVYDLYLYNGSQEILLSTTCAAFAKGQLAGGEIVWVESTAQMKDKNIFVYNGSEKVQLTDDFTGEYTPVINNGQILWNRGNNTLVLATPVEVNVKLQYRNNDPTREIQTIKPGIRLVNETEADLPLEGITLRYWYTNETASRQILEVDYLADESTWSPITNWPYTCVYGSSTAISPVNGANTYMEIGFTADAGNIKAGSAVNMSLRIHAENWNNYDESNDYSGDAAISTFTDFSKITVYQNGQLIWGVEP